MKYVVEMGVIVLEAVLVLVSGRTTKTSSWSHFVVDAERSKSFLVHYFESLECTCLMLAGKLALGKNSLCLLLSLYVMAQLLNVNSSNLYSLPVSRLT